MGWACLDYAVLKAENVRNTGQQGGLFRMAQWMENVIATKWLAGLVLSGPCWPKNKGASTFGRSLIWL